MTTNTTVQPPVNKYVSYWQHDDASWIFSDVFMVLSIQTGFALLESGTASLKNEANIMMKNAIDVLTGGFSFWMFGFGLSYGEGSLRLVINSKFALSKFKCLIQQSFLWLGKILCRCRWFWFSNGRDVLLIFLSICLRRNRSIRPFEKMKNNSDCWDVYIVRNYHNFRGHCGANKLLFLHHLFGVQHIRLLPARSLAVGGDGLPQDDGRGGPGRQLRRQPRGRGRCLRGWEAGKYWPKNSKIAK